MTIMGLQPASRGEQLATAPARIAGQAGLREMPGFSGAEMVSALEAAGPARLCFDACAKLIGALRPLASQSRHRLHSGKAGAKKAGH